MHELQLNKLEELHALMHIPIPVKLFFEAGWYYSRIPNGLRNYQLGDEVHERHKKTTPFIGYAVADSSWRDEEIWITWPLEA